MALELSCGASFGTRVRHRDVRSISLVETVYGAGTSLPPHRHVDPTICLVLGGGYTERFPSTSFLCEPASLVYSSPREVHSSRFGGAGGRCFAVGFPHERIRAWSRDGDAAEWEVSRQAPPSRYAFELRACLCRMTPPRQDEVEELILALLDDLSRGPCVASGGCPLPWLLETRDRVHREFRDVPSLETLAGDAGVHRVHLARAFRSHFGCTVGEYVRRRRVEHACELLGREGEADLAAIAYASGFADQAHMTRTLRRFLGATPGQFRIRYRFPK